MKDKTENENKRRMCYNYTDKIVLLVLWLKALRSILNLRSPHSLL